MEDSAALRLGLLTPVVSISPRSHGAWEADGTPEDLAAIARAADRAGFHHLSCSQHVAVPLEVEARRGHRYYDPVATLAWLAATTERIRLASHVVVLGYQHPLAVVKSWGTLDRLSGGRVILGVGVGSLREEFELLGVPFADRGDRGDEAMSAIASAWGRREPSFAGDHYSFSDIAVDPIATSTSVPMWVGGRSRRSLRRAAQLGDGWAPFGLSNPEIADALTWARESGLRQAGSPFEVVLSAEALDPLASPASCRDTLMALSRAGASIVNVRLKHADPSECIEQIAAIAEVASNVPAAPSLW